MKRFTSILKRDRSESQTANTAPVGSGGGTPVAEIERGVRLFCESGGPNNSGDEVLHLPGIVELAESSPSAAAEAARVIRKFLSTDNSTRAYVQYNAVMLMRILTDNPGPSFTKNLEGKFVTTVNKLLREGRDMSVYQILSETLDQYQNNRGEDETLKPLITMWQNHKSKMAKRGGHDPIMAANAPGAPMAGPNHFYNPQIRHHHSGQNRHQLPPPHELASRVEEAKTSAKLLTQVVQSTAVEDILNNELLKEFVSRCQAASRSVQGFINSQHPPPDEDTLVTLIETNDQLSAALSRHQRAILQARKAQNQTAPADPNGLHGAYAPNASDAPPQQPPRPQQNGPQISAGTGASLVDRQSSNQGYIPPSGPPPTLAMPQPQQRLENPFDDSNRVAEMERNAAVNGAGDPVKSTQATSKPSNVVDDDDEGPPPQQQKRYRF